MVAKSKPRKWNYRVGDVRLTVLHGPIPARERTANETLSRYPGVGGTFIRNRRGKTTSNYFSEWPGFERVGGRKHQLLHALTSHLHLMARLPISHDTRLVQLEEDIFFPFFTSRKSFNELRYGDDTLADVKRVLNPRSTALWNVQYSTFAHQLRAAIANTFTRTQLKVALVNLFHDPHMRKYLIRLSQLPNTEGSGSYHHVGDNERHIFLRIIHFLEKEARKS